MVVEAHLVAANRAPVGWVEGQDDPAPGEDAQREGLVRRHVKREVGCLRSFGENVGHDCLLRIKLKLRRHREPGILARARQAQREPGFEMWSRAMMCSANQEWLDRHCSADRTYQPLDGLTLMTVNFLPHARSAGPRRDRRRLASLTGRDGLAAAPHGRGPRTWADRRRVDRLVRFER